MNHGLLEFLLKSLKKIAKLEKKSPDLFSSKKPIELVHPIDGINLFEYFRFAAKNPSCQQMLTTHSILKTLYTKIKHLKYVPVGQGTSNDGQRPTTQLRKYAAIKTKF